MTVVEILDVFNEQMQKTGTATREEVHAQGLWHQTFHCWIVSGSAETGWKLLFQLRHPDKETFPDKLDTSSAGHLMTGESPEDGVRELEEELGIAVTFSELTYCGTHRDEYRISEHYMDREFTHVYLYVCDHPLEDYQVQHSEVTGLFWIAAESFRDLIHGKCEAVTAEGVIYPGVEQSPVNQQRSVGLDDFTANTEAYYNLLFHALGYK
ncbi:NUDIX hydrolase [Paenibacillus shenyangensis]|uniref:NUDIX hydrolase n=1 Tax=Paenibacillus sp. A9 TaxID=1284352 RepID=UPI00035E58FB|nr:NUDIX domain-containing protein [Paenibacillus sp. A9]